jgi:hypothetical protein
LHEIIAGSMEGAGEIGFKLGDMLGALNISIL